MKLKNYWQEIVIVLLLAFGLFGWYYLSQMSQGTKRYAELQKNLDRALEENEALSKELDVSKRQYAEDLQKQENDIADLKSALEKAQKDCDDLRDQTLKGNTDAEKIIASLKADRDQLVEATEKIRKSYERWKNYATELDTSYNAYIKAVKAWVWTSSSAAPSERGIFRPNPPREH